MSIKNYPRHILTLKHLKNGRLFHRNKFIDKANKEGVEVTNDDVKQKIDRMFPKLEGIKYCVSSNMYLGNNNTYSKLVETLKHRNSVKLINAEIIKNGVRFDFVTCKTSLS